jgi:hypothetical protein
LSTSTTVTLLDQFMRSTNQVSQLEKFANPVQKEHHGQTFPINRPELHYSWWRISPDPFSIPIIAKNQFGDQPLTVLSSRYLLNPAKKNAPSTLPIPVANHYKCYDCQGQPITLPAPITLTDQFYTRTAQTLVPRFFCTPVEKRTQEGLIYPMTDPRQHYTVYEIQPGFQIWPALISDQFITDRNVELQNDRYLMVPTDKTFPPTDTKSSSWGRLKQIYR